MNNKITKFFQGLSLTTFTLAVYNTVNGIKNQKNMSANQEILKDLIEIIDKQKENQENMQLQISGKLDLILKQPNITETYTNSIEKLVKGLESDISIYKKAAERFTDSNNITRFTQED